MIAETCFYVTGGSLGSECLSYVVRPSDAQLYGALQRGEFCYILTSRQLGKSSLMVRTAVRLRQEGQQVAVLDLTGLGQNLTVDQWYYGLLGRLAEQVNLEDELEAFWWAHEGLGPLRRWMAALHAVVLPSLGPAALVIFIDEIDAVRNLPFSTDEFFAAIRECYNRRTQDAIFHKLTFCLLGVAAPTDLIQDTCSTPFNIGRRIELTDFTAEEASPLKAGLGPQSKAAPIFARILYWTGGHPYLTQRLCQAVADRAGTATSQPQNPISVVDPLCNELFLSHRAEERDDNLMFVRDRLLRSTQDLASLLDAYARVRTGKTVRDEATNRLVTELKLSGITRTVGGRLQVRNRIYAQVFDRTWVRENMPYAELWRQQQAYRRGLARALALSGCVLAVVASMAIYAFAQAGIAHRKTDEANRKNEYANHLLYNADMNLIQMHDADNDAPRVLDLLDATQDSKYRDFEWGYWYRQFHLELKTLRGHTDRVFSAVVTPDGKRIVTGSKDNTAKVWDPISGKELLTLKGHTDMVTSVAVSPDGKRIVTGSADHTAKVWDAGTGHELVTLQAHNAPIMAVRFLPDGKRIVTGSFDGTAKVWDANSGRELRTLQGNRGRVTSLACFPDNRRIVIGSPGTAIVWDVNTGRELHTLTVPTAHESPGIGTNGMVVAFSPDGKRIVTGPIAGTMKLWDATTGRELLTCKGNAETVWAVAFSPDGRRILTGAADGTVKLWDAGTGQEMAILKGYTTAVTSVAFFPDGKHIVIGGFDKTLKIWDVDQRLNSLTLKGHDVFACVGFSSDGARIVTGDFEGTAKLWDAKSGQVLLTLAGPKAYVSVALSPDGKRILTGGWGKTARVWDATTGHELLTLTGTNHVVWSVAFSPDGKRIATGDEAHTVTVWDAYTGRAELTLAGHTGGINWVAFSPDGKRIATASDDMTAKLWDSATGREILTFKGHESDVQQVAFSPDGTRIVTASQDNTAKVWNVITGQEILTMKGHIRKPGRYAINSAAYSPDGLRIVTGSADATAKVWDANTGQELLTIRGHTIGIRSVAFSPDGRRILTGGYDGTAKVWEAAFPDDYSEK